MKAVYWKGQNIAWKKLRKVSINGNLYQDPGLEELILLRRKNWIPKFHLPFLAWKLTVQFSSVAQSCLTLCDPVDYSPTVSSIHGVLQARILEWVAISSSRGSPDPGIEPRSPASPALKADSLLLSYSGSPLYDVSCILRSTTSSHIPKSVLP